MIFLLDRIGKELAGDLTLFELIEYLVRMQDSRCRAERMLRIHGTVHDILLQLGVLWECTRGEDFWDEKGHVYLGLLSASTRRSRRIPEHYKRAIVVETRNLSGRGVTKPQQVLLGMQVGTQEKPSKRLKLTGRRAHKGTHDAASSQAPRQRVASTSNASRFEEQESLEYYYDCRRLAQAEKHWSLASDGTTCSFAKTLTTVMYLCTRDLSFWAPPLVIKH